MEGKGANATRGVTCGKRFSRKKDNPRNLGFGPQIRGPKSVLQQELKTRCAERQKEGQEIMSARCNARPKLRSPFARTRAAYCPLNDNISTCQQVALGHRRSPVETAETARYPGRSGTTESMSPMALPETENIESHLRRRHDEAHDRRRSVSVTLDGGPVLAGVSPCHPITPGQIHVGENPIGGSTCGEHFLGHLLLIERGVTPIP
jgi:hypothetical protein